MSSSPASAVSSVGFAELSRLGGIGCLLQPGLLLNQPLKSMRANSFQLIKFCCTRTVPATETESIGLQADPAFGEGRRTGALFFARRLDYFIMTRQFTSIYLDLVPSRHFHHDQRLLVHLPGLAKNAAPQHPSLTLWAGSRQLIKPPGRYA
jgi:hypothetical protein